jgi:hypothetical protein
LSLHIATYLTEYLGEFEFIFETILDYESGDQMGSFDAKKPPSKISCGGTFNVLGWHGAKNSYFTKTDLRIHQGLSFSQLREETGSY